MMSVEDRIQKQVFPSAKFSVEHRSLKHGEPDQSAPGGALDRETQTSDDREYGTLPSAAAFFAARSPSREYEAVVLTSECPTNL